MAVSSSPPIDDLYFQMVRMRAFEEAIADWWARGLISGELHLGIGEEGIIAGVVAHLRAGDSMALDHRSTPPMVARGSDLEKLLLELLGHSKGIGGGKGGHMHLFDRSLLTASSGIVGAGSPTACGFALAHRQQGTDAVAVAFFGESTMNQGMVMESLNLAAIWKLPVLFVVKDNDWAISTRSSSMTGGDLVDRARSYGIPAQRIDGSDVVKVWSVSKKAIDRARAGKGPYFIHATCSRPHGHFEHDPLLLRLKEPKLLARDIRELIASASVASESIPKKIGGIGSVGRAIAGAALGRISAKDPLVKAAGALEDSDAVENIARVEVARAVSSALEIAGLSI